MLREGISSSLGSCYGMAERFIAISRTPLRLNLIRTSGGLCHWYCSPFALQLRKISKPVPQSLRSARPYAYQESSPQGLTRSTRKEAGATRGCILVDRLLRERLESLAPLVMQYLDRPAERKKHNACTEPGAGKHPVRKVPPTAVAALGLDSSRTLSLKATSLQTVDLVCDPNKLRRAREDAMASARDLDQGKHQGTK
ncbi:hypothetical protein GWK47_045026 [Chionoecetes opilio]|uniref:Uncharacterized protein n=1 Tax=Chionoecetes opilio TaxID=41210 RepID=A0A8J5CVE5_CHIOP|nr:hypothetical protein GWK47_045026 [Chionoecetes opilio]